MWHRVPKMITRLQFDRDRLLSYLEFESAMSFIDINRLIQLYALQPSSPYLTSEQFQRVYRVMIKRLFEIVIAIDVEPVREQSLESLKALGVSGTQGLFRANTISISL
jgi:hypothetical protein